MTEEELVDDIMGEILSEERAKLLGPPCAAGCHQPHDARSSYSRCDACERTLRRAPEGWVVACGASCECRECRAKWPRPTDAPPRFDMTAVSEGSLVNIAGSSRTDGKWRVTGFFRPWVRSDSAGDHMPFRHKGVTLCPCEPAEATHVGLYAVCGAVMPVADFRAFATVEGHI